MPSLNPPELILSEGVESVFKPDNLSDGCIMTICPGSTNSI